MPSYVQPLTNYVAGFCTLVHNNNNNYWFKFSKRLWPNLLNFHKKGMRCFGSLLQQLRFLLFEALQPVYQSYTRCEHSRNHITDASCQIPPPPLVTPAQIYWGRLPLSYWWISGVPSQTLKRQTRDIHIRARITPRSSVSALFWLWLSKQTTEDKMWLLQDMFNGRDLYCSCFDVYSVSYCHTIEWLCI